MDNEIKVFKMNDYEWCASKWNIQMTNDWYKEERGLTEEDNPLKEVSECSLDNDGMWCETVNRGDIEKLGDSDELTHYEVLPNGTRKRKIIFGDLMRKDDSVYKYMSFRDAIALDGDFTEPYCIASTDW